MKAEITSGMIFAKSFPSPNIIRLFVDYELREPTPGALTLQDVTTNAFVALHGLSAVNLDSYNCPRNCLACSNTVFPSGNCTICKDVRNPFIGILTPRATNFFSTEVVDVPGTTLKS